MVRSVFVKDTKIAVIEEKEPYRKITLSVRLGNEDISEHSVIVTAEILDSRHRVITACCKKAVLEAMGIAETELAVFLACSDASLLQARITVQEYEKELDCRMQEFHVKK
jgi:hypothetical protein